MGRIDIHCEFCQQPYLFERTDIEALFPERHLQ
jgi:redox-regulated HSP33 family molecular chaperone